MHTGLEFSWKGLLEVNTYSPLLKAESAFKAQWVVLLNSKYLQDEFLLFLGNVFLSFNTLTEEFFSVSTQISLYCNLTVVFSLCSSERSLVLSFLWTYLGSWKQKLDSHLVISPPDWTNSDTLAPSCVLCFWSLKHHGVSLQDLVQYACVILVLWLPKLDMSVKQRGPLCSAAVLLLMQYCGISTAAALTARAWKQGSWREVVLVTLVPESH